MIRSRCRDDVTAVFTSCFCSGSRRESLRISRIGRIPFSGVRISWLMVARNSVLARFAASTASRTDRSSVSSSRWRSLDSSRASSAARTRPAASISSVRKPHSTACIRVRSLTRPWNPAASTAIATPTAPSEMALSTGTVPARCHQAAKPEAMKRTQATSQARRRGASAMTLRKPPATAQATMATACRPCAERPLQPSIAPQPAAIVRPPPRTTALATGDPIDSARRCTT